MNKKELLQNLENEYNQLSQKINRLRNFIEDLDFEQAVTDPQERSLMEDQLATMEIYKDNLRKRIRFQRDTLNKNVGTDNDYNYCSDLSDNSDNSEHSDHPAITGESLEKLIGYQVIGICGHGFHCDGCIKDHYGTPCVKVELVGGTLLCLSSHRSPTPSSPSYPYYPFNLL